MKKNKKNKVYEKAKKVYLLISLLVAFLFLAASFITLTSYPQMTLDNYLMANLFLKTFQAFLLLVLVMVVTIFGAVIALRLKK